ncbi:MAG: hypothetical protein M1835_006938 [Candelina submexicana]|nr:MAG: hypothetical protein M1835_006938 [Candelina submexicana]
MPRRNAREERPNLDLSKEEEKALNNSCSKVADTLLEQGSDYDTTWSKLGLGQKSSAGQQVFDDLLRSPSVREKIPSPDSTHFYLERIYNQKRLDRRKATKSAQGGKSEKTDE